MMSFHAAEVTSRSVTQIQASHEWTKLFPPQLTQYVNSVKFMKQLTVVAVSMITHFKGIFSEDSFQTETLGGVELKILRANCRDESAQFISNALIQSFDAFEKKYLDKLILCFYEDQEDNLVEAHSFEFTYTSSGVTMDIRSAGRGDSTVFSTGGGGGVPHSADEGRTNRVANALKNIRQHTLNLLKNCSRVAQSSRSQMHLPSDVSIRLYYNDEAPAGYQAPGFSPEPRSESGEDPVLAVLADAAFVDLGSVGTQFHTLVARSYTPGRGLASSLDPNASLNTPEISQEDYFREPALPADIGVAQESPQASTMGYQRVQRRVRFQE